MFWITMLVFMSTEVITSHAWSLKTKQHSQKFLEHGSKDRRTAIARLLETPSLAAIYIDGLDPSPAVASDPDQRLTTDDLRRIYDAGASDYENVYTESIVSKALDFSSLRTNLLERVSGDVLELGIGTGLNLPHYPSASATSTSSRKPILTSYTGLDISTKMMELAQQRFARGAPQVSTSLEALYKDNKVRFKVGDVNNLEECFSGSGIVKFDTVVDTFSLCVFPDPSKALQEVRKILKPEGRLLLLEHQDSLISKTLSPTRNIADVSGTCRYNDNVLALLKEAGFSINTSKNLAGGFLVEVVATKL